MYIVTAIENNCIKYLFSFTDVNEAESAFVDLVIDNEGEQPASDELSGGLDDGYWECENGVTICIGSPCNEMLTDIREAIASC